MSIETEAEQTFASVLWTMYAAHMNKPLAGNEVSSLQVIRHTEADDVVWRKPWPALAEDFLRTPGVKVENVLQWLRNAAADKALESNLHAYAVPDDAAQSESATSLRTLWEATFQAHVPTASAHVQPSPSSESAKMLPEGGIVSAQNVGNRSDDGPPAIPNLYNERLERARAAKLPATAVTATMLSQRREDNGQAAALARARAAANAKKAMSPRRSAELVPSAQDVGSPAVNSPPAGAAQTGGAHARAAEATVHTSATGERGGNLIRPPPGAREHVTKQLVCELLHRRTHLILEATGGDLRQVESFMPRPCRSTRV